MQKKPMPILDVLRKSMTFSMLLVLIVFFVAIASSDSMAQSGTGIIRVAPTGSDTPSCGSVASPCLTLQYAVDLISEGGVTDILIAEGTYVYTGSGVSQLGREVVRIVDKGIRMYGGYTTAFTTAEPDTNVTIIDGQSTRRGITVEPGNGARAWLVLSGVTLTNGNAHNDINFLSSFGGGLDSFNCAVTLSNVKVTNNTAQGLPNSSGLPGDGAGGGLSFRQVTASLFNVEITGNTAQGGAGSGSAPRGGLGVGGGLFTIQSIVTVDGLIASNNIARGGDAPGSNGLVSGGVQRADGLGGGIFIEQGTVPSIANLTLTNNTAQGGQAAEWGGLGLGGGIGIELISKTGSISSATIMDNTAKGGTATGAEGGSGLGGGLFITDSNLNLEAINIINNRGIGVSGGTEGGSAGGAGLYFTLADLNKNYNLNGTNLIVGNNTATSGTAVANGLSLGGGLQIDANGVATLNHVTLAGNVVNNGQFDHGAAIFVQNGTTLTSNFGIIADHTGTDAVQLNPTAIATFNGTLWDGNTTNSLVVSGAAFADNNPQSGSPDFVNPTGSPPDFHVKETSAARNKATGSTTPTDIDGQNRPFGSIADLGADEFTPPPSLGITADIKANGSDGPITLGSGNLSVKVSLAAGGSLGINADWWAAEETPLGWFYFDLSTMEFVFAGASPFDMLATHQGPLFDLTPPFEVLDTSGLSSGTYTFYFAIDTVMNGVLDLDSLVFDLVKVVVP